VPEPVDRVGDEPVTELRIVTVHVEDRVQQMRIVPVPLVHRVSEPAVVRLGREAQHPAGHRHAKPVDGKVTDERATAMTSRLNSGRKCFAITTSFL